MESLTKKCGNCASACHLHPTNKHTDLRTLLCNYWVEMVNSNHSCQQYKSHSDAGYAYLQDFYTKQINKHNYPLEDFKHELL